MTTLAIEYYTVARQPIIDVVEIHNGQRHFVEQARPVTGKREARQIAKAIGATPWNF